MPTTIFNAAPANNSHSASQSFVINCVSIADTLNNTNISSLGTTVASNLSLVESQIGVINTNVSAIQQKSTTDEALSSAEVSRATAAELALTGEFNTVTASLATETNRAESAEAVLALNVAANSSAIQSIQSFDTSATYRENSLSSAVQSLNLSRTADETSIAANTASILSLASSRSSDESTISALHVSQSADAANIATNVISIASLQSQVSNLSSNVSTSTLAVSGNVSAGSLNTSLLENDSGSLVLKTTHAQWGTASITLANANGSNGITLDCSASPIEVSEMLFKTSTSAAKLSFNKMPGSEADATNAPDGEFSISTDSTRIMYFGQNSSGLVQGNFKVLNGVVTDVNDVEILLESYWSNAFNNINCPIKLLRKGNMVVVTLMNFLDNAIVTNKVALYNLAVPTAFIPTSGPIQCAVVVTTNGASTIAFASMNVSGFISVGPFSGSWDSGTGGLSGIAQPTSFSYSL